MRDPGHKARDRIVCFLRIQNRMEIYGISVFRSTFQRAVQLPGTGLSNLKGNGAKSCHNGVCRMPEYRGEYRPNPGNRPAGSELVNIFRVFVFVYRAAQTYEEIFYPVSELEAILCIVRDLPAIDGLDTSE